MERQGLEGTRAALWGDEFEWKMGSQRRGGERVAKGMRVNIPGRGFGAGREGPSGKDKGRL